MAIILFCQFEFLLGQWNHSGTPNAVYSSQI